MLSTNITNRISGLIDEPGSAPRSPAQQNASRRNGALSRGPVTFEGKSRSRMNAMKHGLLARVIAPASDIRQQDVLYRKIRRRLMDQFHPDDFSDIAAIDTLAMDYVYLARATQMIEQLHRPQGISAQDNQRWQELMALHRDERLLDRVVKQSNRNDWPLCTREEAERVALRITAFVKNVQNDLAEAEADAKLDGEMENQLPVATPEFPPFHQGPAEADAKIQQCVFNPSPADTAVEEAEEREFRELVKLIGPAAQRLQDLAYVAGVLCGEKEPRSGDKKRLGRLSSHIYASLKQKESGQRDFQRKMENLQTASQMALAQAPQQLITLHRYINKIECIIDRKLRRLILVRELGATRCGASATAAILDEYRKRAAAPDRLGG